MPYYQTAGGSIMEIDVPGELHAAQRHAEAIERGDLVELDPSTVEAYEYDGATRLRRREAPADTPKAKRAPKPAADESPAEDATPEEG